MSGEQHSTKFITKTRNNDVFLEETITARTVFLPRMLLKFLLYGSFPPEYKKYGDKKVERCSENENLVQSEGACRLAFRIENKVPKENTQRKFHHGSPLEQESTPLKV